MTQEEPINLDELLNRVKETADNTKAKALEIEQADNRKRTLFKEDFKTLVKDIITPSITTLTPKFQKAGIEIKPSKTNNSFLDTHSFLLTKENDTYTLSFSGDYNQHEVTFEILIKAPTPANPNAVKKETVVYKINEIKSEKIEIFLFQFFKKILTY